VSVISGNAPCNKPGPLSENASSRQQFINGLNCPGRNGPATAPNDSIGHPELSTGAMVTKDQLPV
jgi:hypothetical protein